MGEREDDYNKYQTDDERRKEKTMKRMIEKRLRKLDEIKKTME